MIALAIAIAIILAFFSAMKKAAHGLAPIPPGYDTSPSLRYQTPQVQTGASPSRPPNDTFQPNIGPQESASYPGTGAKPGGIIVNYGAGFVVFASIGAFEARGLDATGQILFDVQPLSDGDHTANWPPGRDLDHIDLYSFNGITRIQNPLVGQTFDTSMVGSGSSGVLAGPGMDPVGQTASDSNPYATYLAGDPRYALPAPAQAPAYNPSLVFNSLPPDTVESNVVA